MTDLNLNLLVQLDALLSERSVTRAAARLGLTQPTVSAALARLRRHFNDPLLERRGNSYDLTHLAAQLKPLTTAAVESSQRVFAASHRFNPAESDRQFVIAGADRWMETLGSSVVKMAASEDARVTFHFQTIGGDSLGRPEELLRSIDGILAPRGTMSGFPVLDLLEVEWVTIAWTENPHIDEEMTVSHLNELEWVVATGPQAPRQRSGSTASLAMRQLELVGFTPKVAVHVESFLAIYGFIVGTERIALVHRDIAERMAAVYDVTIYTCPFDVPTMMQAFWWHPTHTNDPGHRWLRRLLRVAGDSVAETTEV